MPLYPSVDASPSGAAPSLVSPNDDALDKSVFAFSAFRPSVQGEIETSVAALTLTKASYSVGAAEATQQRSVLRTTSVYSSVGVTGRDTVLVAVQLSDAEGNTAVERSGLVLSLVLSSLAGEVSTVCPLVDAISGLTTCAVVPLLWGGSALQRQGAPTLRCSSGTTIR